MNPRYTPLALVLGAVAALTAIACTRETRAPDRATTDAVTAPGAPAPAPAMEMSRVAGKAEGFSSVAQASPDALQSVTQATVAPSMIIRTGNASVEVDSLELAVERVRQLAQRLGGYIANTSTQTGRGQLRSATLELKIPAARFDEAVSGLSPLGDVESVNVNAEDVGEEFVDVTARQANSKKLEERLLALLATRTGKLEDVLAVERELARVRQEIERFEGRLRYLRTRVATSTLSVTVHERAPIIPPRSGPSPIPEAFREAWRNFVGFVAGLIASLGWLVPALILVTLGVLAWRRWGPTVRLRKKTDGDTPA